MEVVIVLKEILQNVHISHIEFNIFPYIVGCKG